MRPLAVALAGPYNALYLAAIAVAFWAAWREGRRRGWPAGAWLTVLAACVAGGVAGSKLLHFDLHAAGPGEKTILGALLGGALALALAMRVLRADARAPDALAPGVALGVAVGRVGCFLAGCCFGAPTTLPLGVRFGPGTDAYAAQLAAGLIPAGASATLPLHPTQLYEAAAALLLAWALHRHGARLRRPGSAALALLAGLGALRFAVELLRAGGGVEVLGLEATQWTVAAATLLCAGALVVRERAGSPAGDAGPPAWAGAPRAPLLLAGVAALLLLAGGWLTPLEATALLLAAAPAALVLCDRRLGTAGLAAAAVLQLPAADSLPAGADTAAFRPRSYLTVGGGAMAGAYVESCGGAHRYTAGGASVAHTSEPAPHRRTTVFGQLFVGKDEETSPSAGYYDDPSIPDDPPAQAPPSLDFGGVAAGLRLDYRYAGVAFGGVLGDIVFDGESTSGLAPTLGLRAGRLDRVFVEARLFDQEPAAVPAPALQLGLGFGVGSTGSVARVGVSDAGFYGGGNFVTRTGYEIEPFVALGSDDTYKVGFALRRRFELGGAATGQE